MQTLNNIKIEVIVLILILFGTMLITVVLIEINNIIKNKIFTQKETEYEYGFLNTLPTRRNKKTGNVEFVLWSAGEHGQKRIII